MEEGRQGAVAGITVHTFGTTIEGAGIPYFRLCVMRNAIKLEALGIRTVRHSVTNQCKKEFGLKGNRAKVLAQLEEKIAEYVALNQPAEPQQLT